MNEQRYKRSILRLFPFLNDKTKAAELKIDEESIHYISFRDHAKKISLLISHHLKQFNINPDDCIITDCTAGVGGNSISFAMHFKYVYAIELDKVRANYLENNINIYNLQNIKVYNDNCLNLVDKITNHNVVFIDPPWGGKGYKEVDNLRLTLSNVKIESVCNSLLKGVSVKKSPELIVLKLPKNYDLMYLYKKLVSKNMFMYDIDEKMLIVIIINKLN